MITEHDIPRVVQDVKNRLSSRCKANDLCIQVEERDYHLEDNWLYLNVVTPREGIRPYEYAEMLGEIEAELRQEGMDNVLLVPTLPD